MYKREYTKPDGRTLLLYGRTPIEISTPIPSPTLGRNEPASHFRWHPLRGEWVVYAGHRQQRTFLPPPEYSPLAPTTDARNPTELPGGTYDVAVFENLFPTMTTHAKPPPPSMMETRSGVGVCEVVVFTQDPHSSLGSLSLSHVELVLEIWADRYRELGSRDDIQYVFPFENRGMEVGVTLSHPHGQIYAYPFVPPLPALELQHQADYYRAHGRGLLQDHIDAEITDGQRLLYLGEEAVAFVPACARYAYEVWIAPRQPSASLASLSTVQRRDFARALKTVLLKYDGLWGIAFPYVMVFHQAPTDGRPHPESHLHIECYSAYRMPGRLKYLAGSELGAGVFTSDTLPEVKALELQGVAVHLDE
ncbi:galactose-1-phosphate uridylyltransferase [Nitrospira sp. Nam74]